MKGPLLIVFLRKPELGKTKTRLAATVGNERALAIYNDLLKHTLIETREFQATKQAWVAGDESLEDLVGPFGFSSHAQIGADLGKRMQAAFSKGFAEGYGPVLIIGTDCPDISGSILRDAVHALKTRDSVLGPARDGGYYLLGLNEPLNAVFENKVWSTEDVAKDTLKDLEQNQRSVALLPELIDIDTEQDLIDTGWKKWE